MKKILVIFLLGAVSVMSLNAEDLFDECVQKQPKKSACQKLIDKGLPSAKACNTADACIAYAVIYEGADGNQHRALPYYEKACDLKDGSSCALAGSTYYEEKQDFFKAIQYYEKACDFKFSISCNSLGILYAKGRGVRQDKVKAKKYFGKACVLGNQKGCSNYKILNE